MTNAREGAVLVGLDVHGIQSFLFATSKLKEVIGASRIVDDFTGSQADDVPIESLKALGLQPVQSGKPNGDRWYLPVRLGGGVARVLLPNADLARKFIRLMSEWALKNAAGLEFDADWVEFDLSGGDFAKANAELIERINQQRQHSTRGNAFNGFPCCAPCRLTGDPAEGYDGPNERLCASSLDKRAYQSRRDDRWASVKDEPILEAFEVDDVRRPFVFDLESMQGDEASDSYMAVVALDLNNLGEASKKAVGTKAGIEALHATRQFVEKVAGATAEGFSKALNELASNSESRHEFAAIEGVVKRCGKLPLRPLVFGGDDLTFVMHAALAPRFAVTLARALEAAGYASGVGIAFVKTKSPLSRAIDLAEALLARAKRAGRDQTRVDFMLCSAEIPANALDRETSGDRPARGPYALEDFESLVKNATLLHHELPSSHVRGAADGFQQSIARGRDFLRDLMENIDRRLGGGGRATPAARALLGEIQKSDRLAATYLDCVDLRRFIAPRPDRGTGAPRATQKSEVIR
ncbi:MAG: hypothetical protein QM516_14125 [Limnohabitans sp.]|nr:hypothetical protein [Limnohabitans sp.]